MSDPLIVPPSLATLPTQLLSGAPAWYWRYASVATVSFLLAVAGDYYLGSPGVGWIRAWAGQKAKAVELRPLGVLPDTTEKRIADLEAQSMHLLSDTQQYADRLKQLEGKINALEAVGAYTIGRVGTLETYMGDRDQPKRVKGLTLTPKAVQAAPVDPGPVAKIGGTP